MIIRDILNSKGQQVYSIGPDQAAADAVRLMVDRDISSLVVIKENQMVGIITLRELLRGLYAHAMSLSHVSVADIMSPDPIIGGPEDTVDYVRGVMTENHITHLPVMDQERLVGIISFHDVAKACINDSNFENILLKRYIRNWPGAE